MRKSKKIILAVLIGVTLCSPVTALASSMESESHITVEPRVDAFKWKFKVFNRKLYKRLYNIKTGEFVGEWILVG